MDIIGYQKKEHSPLIEHTIISCVQTKKMSDKQSVLFIDANSLSNDIVIQISYKTSESDIVGTGGAQFD